MVSISRYVAALVLLVGATPTWAQLTAPVDIGSNTANGSFGTTLNVITTAPVPAKGSIIVVTGFKPLDVAAPTTATCTDSNGNSYNTDVSRTNGNDGLATICSTHGLASSLPAGSTITVSWAVQAPNTYLVHAFSVTGLASSPLDQVMTGNARSTSPSSGATATTTQANELLFGAVLDVSQSAALASFSPGAGYTSLGTIDDGGTAPALFAEYQLASATGSYAADATIANSAPWVALIATYKAAQVTPVRLQDFDVK